MARRRFLHLSRAAAAGWLLLGGRFPADVDAEVAVTWFPLAADIRANASSAASTSAAPSRRVSARVASSVTPQPASTSVAIDVTASQDERAPPEPVDGLDAALATNLRRTQAGRARAR